MAPSGRSFYVNLTDSPTLERYDLGPGGKLQYAGCMSEDPESDCEVVDMSPSNITLATISNDGESYYFGYGGNWSIFSPED